MKQFLWCLCLMLAGVVSANAQLLKPALKDGKWGYQDAAGNWVIAPTFTKASEFATTLELAPVAKGRNWGFIDMSGRFVIGCFFDEVGSEFVSDVVEVCQNGKWGFIDLNGQMLVPAKYSDRSKCLNHRDKAARKAKKLRKERRYEWVERRIREAADQTKALIQSASDETAVINRS